MKPSFTYEEIRDLIRQINCMQDVHTIKYLLRSEGKRYTLNEIHALHRQLQIAEINLSFK